MSDDRERKSWREIDQMKDRAFASKAPKKLSQVEERAQKLASKAARSDLEKLFGPSGLSKEKAAQLEEIKALRGKSGFYEKLDQFYQQTGCPLDWDLQMLFLDHRNSKIVVEVLQALQKTAPLEKLEKQDFLAQKLRVMAVSTFDSDVARAIESLQRAMLRK